MIYLFNSAVRPLYLKNVLNTLALPHGWINEYRYKLSEYVSQDIQQDLSILSKGSECLISFIDRFDSKGYDYHPLRRGALLSHRQEDEMLHLKIVLGDFVYPTDHTAWRQQLLAEFASKHLAALTSADPENTHDGLYVLQGKDLLSEKKAFLSGEKAWVESVVAISATAAFANASPPPVFIRLEARREERSKKPIKPKVREESAAYLFKPDQRCVLVVNYRFPLQRADKSAKASLTLRFGEALRSLGGTSVSIDSYSNSVVVPFISKRYREDSAGTISLSDDNAKGAVLTFDGLLPYQVREGGLVVKVLLLLIVYAVASAVTAVDFSKLCPFTWLGLVRAAIPKFGGGVVQAFVLFWIFRMLGKKPI
jgi:hypothetical protein